MQLFGRIALAVLALLVSGADAFAHTRSETQSVWRIVGSTVHVAYTIPDTPHANILPGQNGVKMIPINRMAPRSLFTRRARDWSFSKASSLLGDRTSDVAAIAPLVRTSCRQNWSTGL